MEPPTTARPLRCSFRPARTSVCVRFQVSLKRHWQSPIAALRQPRLWAMRLRAWRHTATRQLLNKDLPTASSCCSSLQEAGDNMFSVAQVVYSERGSETIDEAFAMENVQDRLTLRTSAFTQIATWMSCQSTWTLLMRYWPRPRCMSHGTPSRKPACSTS